MNSNSPADGVSLNDEAIQELLQRNDAREMLRAATRLQKWLGNVRELVHELEQVIVELEGSTSNQGDGDGNKKTKRKEVS
jgi:DNA-binding NtrC family response regulator